MSAVFSSHVNTRTALKHMGQSYCTHTDRTLGEEIITETHKWLIRFCISTKNKKFQAEKNLLTAKSLSDNEHPQILPEEEGSLAFRHGGKGKMTILAF